MIEHVHEFLVSGENCKSAVKRYEDAWQLLCDMPWLSFHCPQLFRQQCKRNVDQQKEKRRKKHSKRDKPELTIMEAPRLTASTTLCCSADGGGIVFLTANHQLSSDE
jgi:hypothetical protein